MRTLEMQRGSAAWWQRATEGNAVKVAARPKLTLVLWATLLVVTARASATIYFVHPNHLGTPLAITSQAGAVVWRADSDPFGKANVTLSTVTMNLRLPGQYFDAETGVHYNYFRDYDPVSGRYLQSDPSGLAGGTNTYAYVGSDPLRFFDPYGLDETMLLNSDGGRNAFLAGPSNGNWGGQCWSGGMYSCGGKPGGDAPPTDSADRCYKHHDKCYEACGEFPDPKCIAICDAHLVDELEDLPNDPRWWVTPPRSGTEKDSRIYRDVAIELFRKRLGAR